jgi:hypothetical protein
MSRYIVLVSISISVAIFSMYIYSADADDPNNRNLQLASNHGWLENYKRGDEILNKLTSLTPEEQKRFDVASYRNETVAFVGGGAPPGATNDLMTKYGFYLRVVNSESKDLRPHSVWWEVIVRGKIMQVLPGNKIIIIKVDENDWATIQTG